MIGKIKDWKALMKCMKETGVTEEQYKGANIETDKPEWETIFFRLLSTAEQQAAIIDKQRQEIDELKSLISRK